MIRIALGVLAVLFTTMAASAQDPLRADGWVVLSLDDYRSLRARAFPAPPDLSPPVDVSLTRVDYALRVGADTVTGEAQLTVDVLKQGWVGVRMPSGLLVRSVRLEGRPVALLPGNPPQVLMSRAGRSVLTLEVVVPITTSGGTETMTLPPAASVSAIALTIPRIGVDLTATGGVIAEHTESTTETRWVVYGMPERPVMFSWKRKSDDRRSTLPLRTRVQVNQLIALGEETSAVTANIRAEIVQGTARQIVLAIPDHVTINHVSGATVADWQLQQGSLTVSFLEPVTTHTSFVVSAESRLPREGPIAIPIVRVPGAERETGGIAVDIAGAGEIGERQGRGLDPADPSEVGDVVAGRASPSMVAFRFSPLKGDAARSLTVTVSRYTPKAVLVANVEEARFDTIVAEDGKTLVRARYAVRNNQRSFLAVTLPAQATLWSASLSGRPVRPGVSTNGNLLLPLQKGRSGEDAPVFVVEVVYLHRSPAWSERGDSRLELAAVDLPITRTGLALHYSPRYRLEVQPGVFRPANDPGPWSVALRHAGGAVGAPSGAPAPPPPAHSDSIQELKAMDMRKDSYRSLAGVVPVDVPLPPFGATLFVAAELTPENRAPALDLKYKRD